MKEMQKQMGRERKKNKMTSSMFLTPFSLPHSSFSLFKIPTHTSKEG
jgi:hypothetical protein